MSYKSFYHLHIPRTGGRYVKHNIINFLKPYMIEQNIKIINDVEISSLTAHACWDKEINDDTYIFSSFRNPITHVSSLYYVQVVIKDLPDQIFPNKLDYDKLLFDKNLFMEYFINNVGHSYMMSNHQSKNLLYKRPFINGPLDFSINPENNYADVLEKAQRINLFVRMEDITNNQLVLAKKIIDDMDLQVSIETISERYNAEINQLKIWNSLFKVSDVTNFANSFNDDEKLIIYNKTEIDNLIYKNNELFYKPIIDNSNA
jgi:hypothetical protein